MTPQRGSERSRPTIARIREVGQPPDILGRRNSEHWTGEVYTRRVSPYLTRVALTAGVSANTVTWIMVVTGWLAAAALLIPGLKGAVLAVLLAHLQMVWDCSDGEVARWRGTMSPAGVFLDKVAHYSTEVLVAVAVGARASGGVEGLHEASGWTTLGTLLAVLIMFNKLLNDLVHVSRAHAGLDKLKDSHEAVAPRPGLVAKLRRAARFFPVHRAYHAVELTTLFLVAAVVDAVTDDLSGTRVFLAVLLPLTLLVVVGHATAILTSARLRAEQS
jgi:phosphatidylglycerophosphate synthase